MPLIFGDDGGELGQLGHLMPRRRRIERPRFLRQGRLAMSARRRHVLHEFVDALRRQQHLQMRRMPRLTARFLASWLLGRPLGQRRCRPWRRRQLGQVVQPRLQLGHLGFQDGQASIPLTTTWTFGLIHAARLLTAPPSSCASFYLNGHTTGERLLLLVDQNQSSVLQSVRPLFNVGASQPRWSVMEDDAPWRCQNGRPHGRNQWPRYTPHSGRNPR